MTSTRGNCLRAPFSPVPDFPSELAHVFVDAAVILRSWVVLKNSDIVSADLAAAAVSGGQRLGSSTIPSWYASAWLFRCWSDYCELLPISFGLIFSCAFGVFVLQGYGGLLEAWCTRSFHSTTELGSLKVHKNIRST